jgi:outer membrane protein OmpA-like peptidoglycan-associated protein
LPQRTKYRDRADYIEIIKTLPPEEILKVITVSLNEFILFGPDIGKYNIGIDHDAQSLNELVLNATAQTLKDHPNLRVRVEGNANPVTKAPGEADVLMALGAQRANEVAEQLRARGVNDEQMVIVSFGGTRTVTHEHIIWNRNRRVELIIIQVDAVSN